MNYSELQVTSNFSFLEGASHPDELVEQAALYGYKEIAITDRNSFAGIVRAHAAAKGKNSTINSSLSSLFIRWTKPACISELLNLLTLNYLHY
jgi:DNA polymerase III alpha subunit